MQKARGASNSGIGKTVGGNYSDKLFPVHPQGHDSALNFVFKISRIPSQTVPFPSPFSPPELEAEL